MSSDLESTAVLVAAEQRDRVNVLCDAMASIMRLCNHALVDHSGWQACVENAYGVAERSLRGVSGYPYPMERDAEIDQLREQVSALRKMLSNAVMVLSAAADDMPEYQMSLSHLLHSMKEWSLDES